MRSIWISAVGAAEPGAAIPQQQVAAWLSERLHPGSDRQLLLRLAETAGVTARHAACDLLGDEGELLYPRSGVGGADMGERSRIFADRAPAVAALAVRRACPGGIGLVTHLVVATCTGAVAPGLDILLATALGLPPTVRRVCVGFMGCYAAITALRTAWHTCAADPNARVLVVCCELSSLHLRPGPEEDALVAAMLFGDGAAAAMVESHEQPVGIGVRIRQDAAWLAPDTADCMRWTAAADGFRLQLSSRIPADLLKAIPPLSRALLPAGVMPTSIAWMVHPGGPRILDATARALELPQEALQHSRAELARAGNRSSPTVLAILARHVAAGWQGLGALLAFGPGLTLDALLCERVPVTLALERRP